MVEKNPELTEELNDKSPEQTIIETLENRIDLLEKDMKDTHNIIQEKNKNIEILTIANIDLINIDMEMISDELHQAEVRLNEIGTIKQFNELREIETTKGLNMAYQTSKIFLEHAGKESQIALTVHHSIKLNLEKLSEKLKYASEV